MQNLEVLQKDSLGCHHESSRSSEIIMTELILCFYMVCAYILFGSAVFSSCGAIGQVENKLPHHPEHLQHETESQNISKLRQDLHL